MPSVVEEVDHISLLPEAMIHHIFCFLPFKDVVRTSVLSKQWRSAWTSTPYIDLSLPSRHVVPSIGSALSLCKATKVEKFHVDVAMYDFNIAAELDGWFRFAAARRMEDVSLAFKHGYHPAPLSLCDCASLVSLRLSRCHFSSDVTIHWPSLKKLSLHYGWLDEDQIVKDQVMKILSGCPALESLALRSLWHTCNLRIDSKSLRELAIGADYISSLDISAPNLLRLRLSGELHLTGLIPNGLPSLVEAGLNFEKPTGFLEYFPDRLKLLLEQLQPVAKITIGSECLEVLSFAEAKGMSYVSSRWRDIRVYTTVCEHDLRGMAYLLQSSPLLERLVICNSKFDKIKDFQDIGNLEKQFLTQRKGASCWANRLKRVEIVGFQFDRVESKLLLALAKFLLRKAVRLEKMIINTELRKSLRGAPIYPHDLIRLQKGFRREGCRRASRNAEVIVNYL